MLDGTSKTTSAAPVEENQNGGILYLYRELWKQSYGNRAQLIWAMVLLASAQLILLSIPYSAGKAINTLQSQGVQGLGDALVWLLLVLGATVAHWVLHGPGRLLERNASLKVRSRIASGLIEKLLKLPLAWHEQNHSVATSHRVTQSSAAMASFAESQFLYLSISLKVVGPVVALWVIQLYVGLAAALGFFGICLSIVGFERLMLRFAHKTNDAERRYTAALVDALSNSVTVVALRQSRGVMEMIQKKRELIFVPSKRSIVLNEVRWCRVDTVSRALACFLVALFAWLASRGYQTTRTWGGRRLRSITMGDVELFRAEMMNGLPTRALEPRARYLVERGRQRALRRGNPKLLRSIEDLIKTVPRTVGERTSGKCLTLLSMMFNYALRKRWIVSTHATG